MDTETVIVIGRNEPCPDVEVDVARTTRLARVTLQGEGDDSAPLTLWATPAVVRQLHQRLGDQLANLPQQCSLCGGEGVVDELPCAACAGGGEVTAPVVDETLPAWDVVATVKPWHEFDAEPERRNIRVHADNERDARAKVGRILADEQLMLEAPIDIERADLEAVAV